MKKQHFGVILVHVVFLISPLVLVASNRTNSWAEYLGSNTITGHVFGRDRAPVPEVYVELQNEINTTVGRVKTNSSGTYRFGGLSSGRFTVRVLPYGTDFEEQSAEVEFSSLGELRRPNAQNAIELNGQQTTQSLQQDFHLKPRRESDRKAISGTIFVQDVPEDARKALERGLESFKQKKSDEGIVAMHDALKLYPDYYLALERLGEEYASQQKWSQAYDIYKKTVAVNERSFTGWYGLSFAAFGSGKTEEAVTAGQKAVSIRADSIQALLLLGICQRKIKQYSDAEKSLKGAEKFSKGKSPDVHWNLALLYAHNLKKYDAAADHLERYLIAKPDAPDPDNVKKLIKQFREQASRGN